MLIPRITYEMLHADSKIIPINTVKWSAWPIARFVHSYETKPTLFVELEVEDQLEDHQLYMG